MTLTSTFKLAGLLLMAALVVLWGRFATTAQAKGQKQPNIVLITTDDQPLTSFQQEWMPNVFQDLAGSGTVFKDAVVNEPLCAPSRSTLLTGQYAHNQGVLTNDDAYSNLVDPGDVLPVWLQRAGYRTGHFGKWLHGYETDHGYAPAPGWDRWVTLGDKRRYYDYEVSVDGEPVKKGSKPNDHVTAVTSRAATRFVSQNVKSKRPLFMQVDYFAPHESGRNADPRCAGAPEPVERDIGAAKGQKTPRGPSFNEEDVSDKPYYERLGEMTEGDIKTLDRRYRCIAESLLGVDRGIGTLVDRFRTAHELRNTTFVFMTDNGISLGEHRVRDGKSRPWEESIRTPLVIRMPRSAGETRDVVRTQVAGIDIAPTLLDLAGADPCDAHGCRVMDGRSLVGPATGDSSGFADRAVLVELAETPTQEKRAWACSFQALRTADEIIVEATRIPDPDTKICEDEKAYEFYNLASDPFELDNRINGTITTDGPKILSAYQRLQALRDCSGIEGRDPASAGGYCE